MEKFEIQKLRDLPIEGVAERLGLEVKRHACLCPFHDDHTPSLRFSVSKNTFKCFVCDAHGGVIDLAMKKLGKSFLEACQWLADGSNIILTEYDPSPLTSRSSFAGFDKACDSKNLSPKRSFDPQKYLRFFEHPWLNDAAVRFLYQERHLDPRVVQWCRLNSFCDRNGINWLQIPYYDINGNLIGVQSRNLGPLSSAGSQSQQPLSSVNGRLIPRFKFPYGSRCPIYNLPVLKLLRPNEPLYITEGASDCWSMLSSGHKAIAIPSATLLTKKNLELLGTLKPLGTTLHMYPDADIPGEKLYLQLTQLSLSLGLTFVRHSLPYDCKDYSDYYVKHHLYS